MSVEDFIMTLDSDAEDTPARAEISSRTPGVEDVQLDPAFTFDFSSDIYQGFTSPLNLSEGLAEGNTKPVPVSISAIISKRRERKHFGKRKRVQEVGEESESDDRDSGGEEDHESQGGDTDELDEDGLHSRLASSSESEKSEAEAEPSTSESDIGDDEEDTVAEKARKTAFFASDVVSTETHSSFLTMNLSRPLLKALTSLGFHTPTPIQAATIPVGLLGKDIVGNAVTGSGKTAAFIIPMIERLLYRDKGKKAAAIRCIILVPTRELAVQCYDVGRKLAVHTDIQFCLVVGGLSLKAQEVALRSRPDILIATPGRLIDHLRNSPSFSLDALDIIVLDEADRMLSEGFQDELTEILKSCPKSRQTMLFSATMTDTIDELIRMSLNKPVRLFVDPNRTMARGLVQEFVRVRAERESDRSALLVTLCKRTFKSGVLIFLRSKKLAHQLRIVFGLLDMSCEELHGDLSQEQRLKALQSFRDGKSDFLMATDLASRGLDIKGVETVINYDMPGQLAQYLHRVGRTARAGKIGRSITLVGEADRKVLKSVIKQASETGRVRNRTVPPEIVARWSQKLESLKDDITAVLQEEKEAKQLRQAELELVKGQNIIEHEQEILSRPARSWFQSKKEKERAEAAGRNQYENIFPGRQPGPSKKSPADPKPKRDKLAGLNRRAKRRKLALEEDMKAGGQAAIASAIRLAKKNNRATRIAAMAPQRAKPDKFAKKRASKNGAFERDLSSKKEAKPKSGRNHAKASRRT